MKKTLLILILVIVSCSLKKEIVSDQKVSVLEINKDSTYQKPESILFVFTGHTHLINYYKDLANTLKKDFREKNIKVNFNYYLAAEKSFQVDLNNIPKQKFYYKKYTAVCSLNVSYPYEHRRRIYGLDFNSKTTDSLKTKLKGILAIKFTHTISDYSKESSKKLVEIITK